MAEKRRFLDVWLVEANTVYREVPYTVVADWIQQSRLVGEDMVRPSGTREWFKIGGHEELSSFLPRSEPMAVGDEAEALEAVRLDFNWKQKSEVEDDDIDMIPLIDISLVLLIFFIMTSVGTSALAMIETPATVNGLLIDNNDLLYVGITLNEDNEPRYFFGVKRRDNTKKGTGPLKLAETMEKETQDQGGMADKEAFLQEVKKVFDQLEGPHDITIEAHRNLPSGQVRQMILDLGKTARGTKVTLNKYISVSEKDPAEQVQQ